MLYYNKNNGETDIEIVNPKTKRRQLARIAYPHLKAENIRPGGKLVIFGKQYNVEDFGCPFTREQLGKMSQTCVTLRMRPSYPYSRATRTPPSPCCARPAFSLQNRWRPFRPRGGAFRSDLVYS